MSGKDHDHIDDAQFAAFLQGDDALSRDLAALDQPAPPPALDAAIQARIAAALAAEKLAELPAANDPVAAPAGSASPDAAPAGARWQSRWQLPLALAAGVAAVSVALPLWQTHDPVTESWTAATPLLPAPVIEAAPAQPASATQAEPAAPAEPAAGTATGTTAAAPTAGATAAEPAAAAKAPARAAAQQAPVAAQHPAGPAPRAPATVEQLSRVAHEKAEVQDVVVAEDVGARPVQTASPAMPRAAASNPAPAPAPAPAAAPAPAQPTAPVLAPAPAGSLGVTVIANASNVRPGPQFGRTPALEESSKAGIDYRAAKQPAYPPAPAPLAFAPMPRAVPEAAPVIEPPQTVSVTGSRVAAPGQLPAKEWLQKIEALLQAGERGAALAEWQKFRAAYPAYPVPEQLAAKFPPPAQP